MSAEPRSSRTSAARRADPAGPARAARGTSAATKLSTSLGIVAAMALAVLVNVYTARHYHRWDWTRGGLYTLSDATLQTLRALEEPVQVYVLLSSGDPLAISVRHLLEAYQGETSRLELRFTDPDRNPAEFLAVQQRYNIVPGRTEDGRIITDAVMVIVRGDRPHFVTSRDLVEVDDADDLRARPRLEQAITAGIRSAVGGERPKACFTTGNGERLLDDHLSPLKERLIKNNYDVTSVEPATIGASPPSPSPALPAEPARGGKLALGGCRVVVMAGPNQRVSAADVQTIKAYVEGGGNLLLVAGQEPEGDEERYLELGLDELFAIAGVRLEDDFIFERAPERRTTGGAGETFLPVPRPHAITEGLIKATERGQELDVVMTVASSMSPTGAGSAGPVPLLVTSDQAFGMVDFFAWAKNPSAHPRALDTDHKGPLTVAYAAELPKRPGRADAPHGPRIVAVSSVSVLHGANWRDPQLRATALFVESAISWLAAKPVHLDIPNKPMFTAGLRLTEDSVNSVFRSVVVIIPLASLLGGVAMYLRRWASEKRGKRRPQSDDAKKDA